MNRLRRKLILTLIMLAFTVVCLTSVTYAWFSQNREAWTEDFDIEIKNTDGISISVDGTQFRSSIPAELVKKAIVAKKYDVSVNDLLLSPAEIETEYRKIELESVTTSDLKTFMEINDSEAAATDNNNKWQLKEVTDKSKYISFDLWFRVENSTSNNEAFNKQYELALVDNLYYDERLAAGEEVIKPKLISTATEVRLNTDFMNYKSGDMIEVNPENAMRIGFLNGDAAVIYEPTKNVGLGSYALEGELGIYDPMENEMLQYLNAYTAPYSLEPIKENIELYKNTVTFNEYKALGEFNSAPGTAYNDIKLTVFIWLEGYDADYMLGVDVNKLVCSLNFYKKEIGGNN